jgi:uncharacterized DUF497 family protein
MLTFEWDRDKARANFMKHGVTFETARRAFDDPDLILAEDADHSAIEMRYFAFGRVHGGILTVRFTVRLDRVRILGAGFWRKGRLFYEQANHLRR